MLFEQVRDRERGPRGHERGALAPHVAARLDRLDHRRVRRRPADAALLELLHEARLGVARRRLRLVADRRELGARDRVAFGDRRAGALRSRPRRPRRRLRCTRAASRGSRRSCPTRGTSPRSLARRRRGEPDRHLAAARVDHLARDRADPDQLVEALLVGVELGAHRVGRADAVAGGADRLVRFLRVLHLAAVRARLGGQVLVAVLLADRGARRGDRLLRQVRAVGSHVGDVAALVEPLRDRHRARRREAQLAARLLLQRRRRERRAWAVR